MSCKLITVSKINNLVSLKRLLFKELNIADESSSDEPSEGWGDGDWGWKEDEEENEEEKGDEEAEMWLNNCYVALSPTGDTLAFARDNQLVLLHQRWNSGENDLPFTYEKVFEANVNELEKEVITCVTCIPLASQKRSNQGGPDWTCVLVGFSSGYIRVYTEIGTQLFSQLFCEDPVKHIYVRTYQPPRHMVDAERHEDITIMYAKHSLVLVDGFSFMQTLKACRNQVAKAQASGMESVAPPPLAYKKWGLQEQDIAEQHVACGLITPNSFDQMQTASFLGGFYATVRSTPPASHVYLAIGSSPYMAFYYAVEGLAPLVLSDVAHAVASKLKSALFSQISSAGSWLGFGANKNADPTGKDKRPVGKIERPSPLPLRFGLDDRRREGLQAILSPDNKLIAAADSFGRVVLFDVLSGVAVRMWKGYRDAQLAWMEITENVEHIEDRGSNEIVYQRRVLFLVIYAPRRGLLEVWLAQQGPRVAAFNVSRFCRLLHCCHGILGLNNITYKEVKNPLFSVVMLDPSGALLTVEVPFHVALDDSNSKRARDLYLLMKLKTLLKENSSESDPLQNEIANLLQEIKTPNIKQQALERLLQTRYLSTSLLQTTLSNVRKAVESAENVANYESRVLQQLTSVWCHLLDIHSRLVELQNAQADVTEANSSDIDSLASLLHTSPEELTEIRSGIVAYLDVQQSQTKVRTKDATLAIADFISFFDWHQTGGQPLPFQLKVKPGLSDTRLHRLASFFFGKPLVAGTSVEFNDLLQETTIVPEDLMGLLCTLWLSDDGRNIEDILHLSALLKSVSSLKGEQLVREQSSTSPWWANVREKCSQSENVCAAYLLSLAARGIATILANSAANSDTADQSTDWEALTIEKTLWSMLVSQLENLLLLQTLVKLKPASLGLANKPVWDAEPVKVSVKKVMEGGRGKLAELVSKWVASQGISPAMLCHTVTASSDRSSGPRRSSTAEEKNIVVVHIERLQNRLPHSLSSDALMANCAWEYMVLWNKDPEIIFALQQAFAYFKCIQSARIQHGLFMMIWSMFVSKKFSATALLTEKVGKAPKDRLCRKDVGLSSTSLIAFFDVVPSMLDIVLQTPADSQELASYVIEDLWQNVQGPTSLVELALEQKAINYDLAVLHYHLGVILQATVTFELKSVKPLSLFDKLGQNAFFKPLHTSPNLPSTYHVDVSLMDGRTKFIQRLVTALVQSVSDAGKASPSATEGGASGGVRQSISGSAHRSPHYTMWCTLIDVLTAGLGVDADTIRRHHAVELYSFGLDELAHDVLVAVSNHPLVGVALLDVAGQRLHHFVYVSNPASSVDKLADCSTSLSAWLATLDSAQLKRPDPPLTDTAELIGQAMNQLPETHSNYSLAAEAIEFIQRFS